MANEKEKLLVGNVYVNSKCLPHSCSSMVFEQGLSECTSSMGLGSTLESQFSLYYSKDCVGSKERDKGRKFI